jgi:hypothetical protein
MEPQDVTAQYAVVLARAQAAGLSVIAHGVGDHDGVRYYFVESSAGPQADWHRVWVEDGRLQCSCEAGRYAKVCMHKAVTREALKAEQAVSRAEAEQRVQRDVTAKTVTFEDRPGRQRACASCGALFTEGESIVLKSGRTYCQGCHAPAPLARNNAPVTPWKA